MPHTTRKPAHIAVSILATLALALACAGCNASDAAQRAQSVVAAVLQIAQAEEPALPPSDAAIVTPWVTLGVTLDGQLETCLATATTNGSKKSAFLACFNTFSQGLLSPAELAQLRVLSPASQKTAQLWITAISVGINVAVPLLGGTAQAPPAVSSIPPTSRELASFAARLGADAYTARLLASGF
jgi:hypothetical protein